jgi:hypothetical protein
MKYDYFECDCQSPEHRLVFIDTNDEYYKNEPRVYTEVYLNNYRGFFKRILVAIKYILGYKCRYGHFDNFELNSNDINRLQLLIEGYIERYGNWAKNLKNKEE